MIAILNYLKPIAEIDIHRPTHFVHLKFLLNVCKLFVSGRQNPLTGSVIMVKALTEDEMHDVMAQDPYIKKGLAEYQII